MTNRLAGMRCYLCGAMDRVADRGIGWRKHIREDVKDLGITWLDPTRKPTTCGMEDEEGRAGRAEMKARGDFQAVTDAMKPIRRIDLRMVDVADFLIVNLDMDVHACGTYNEVTLATQQKKPIIFHIEQGVNQAPDWLFSMTPWQLMFDEWSQVHQYLWHVAHGRDVETFDRWCFFEGLATPKQQEVESLKRLLTPFDSERDLIDQLFKRLGDLEGGK